MCWCMSNLKKDILQKILLQVSSEFEVQSSEEAVSIYIEKFHAGDLYS